MVWIFLRGLTREATHWGGFPEDFGRALPSEQVILLDLPGNGQLHLVRSPLSIQMVLTAVR